MITGGKRFWRPEVQTAACKKQIDDGNPVTLMADFPSSKLVKNLHRKKKVSAFPPPAGMSPTKL
jgi:hypothetical protein